MNIHDFDIENFPMDHCYGQPFWKWRLSRCVPDLREAIIIGKIDQWPIHSYTSVILFEIFKIDK